jgi:hypothetical protein
VPSAVRARYSSLPLRRADGRIWCSVGPPPRESKAGKRRPTKMTEAARRREDRERTRSRSARLGRYADGARRSHTREDRAGFALLAQPFILEAPDGTSWITTGVAVSLPLLPMGEPGVVVLK